MSVEFQAFWEAVIGALLWVDAAVLVMTHTSEVREINVFWPRPAGARFASFLNSAT